VTGPGGAIGDELAENPAVDGVIFTGSRDVGMRVYRQAAQGRPRPVIAEMGGKNPVIVSASADLAAAAEGTARSAFGFSGQKCSAASRAYVHRRVYDDFLDALARFTAGLNVGDPTRRETYMGPVINRGAYEKFQRVTEQAREEGGRFVSGGDILHGGDYDLGYYVQPTIVDGLPKDHPFFREELFLPFLVVAPVESLDEAITEANKTDYGLTAGIFSRDQAEIQRFFDQVEAGVLYANRRGGATTGAWPGAQTFVGWKYSGTSGKGALGPYYVQQFLREQNRTIVE
jgi:1-pyrroline-5-carboxylate dehydrogenase